MALSGEIVELDQEIERREDDLIGRGWVEGNVVLGWPAEDHFPNRRRIELMPRHRLFSLSSTTSYISQHLPPYENDKTSENNPARFRKK